MKMILTKLAILMIVVFNLSQTLIADVDKDLDYMKDNLPYLMESNNAGMLFYMTFHPCWENPGPNNAIRIYVSSAVKTKVTLEIKDLGLIRTKQTIPNDIIEFILSPTEAQAYSKGSGVNPIPPRPEQIWKGRAIKLYAESPIIAYGVTRYRSTSDGYLAYPVTSLGKVYQVASYADPTNNTSQFLPSYTSIVGVYDNTKVTFRMGGCESCRVPKEDGDTLKAGELIRRTLNEGDVWLIPGIGPFNDLSGSKVIAEKPVALISGNFCAYIPSHIEACDFIIEQDLPENVWGTRYHVTQIISRKKFSIIKIFAKMSNTQVFADGIPMWNILTPGGILGTGYIETRAGIESTPRPVVIHSKKGYPINVVQYNTGQRDDGISSDPFQLQLTPMEQYQKEIVFNTPGIKGGFGFRNNYINLVYKATVDGGIPDNIKFAEVINGKFNWQQLNAIQSNPGFKFAYDTPDEDNRSYYSKTIVLPYDGVFRLKSDEPFAAYAYGFSDWDSYGFPASISTADLETPDSLAPFIEYKNYCDGFVAGSVFDEPRIDPPNRSNMGLIYMDNISFNYKFKVEDFVVGVTPTTTWTLDILDPTVDAKAYLIFIDRAGNRKDTVIEHYALKPEIVEYATDYGLFKLENPARTLTKSFTLINGGSRNIDNQYSIFLTLDSKIIENKGSDINKYQNFDLEGVENLNLSPLEIGHEIKFDVTFTAREEGSFKDSIGVIVIDNSTNDTCFFHYFTLIEAIVGNQYIMADDYYFPETIVGTRTNAVTLQVKNPQEKPYHSTTPLIITGYILSGDKIGSGEIFEVKGLENISQSNPLVLEPGQAHQFSVSFRPDAVRDYASEITFIADAIIPDNVTKLTGKGVQPKLAVNSEDWGRKRVDPNSYKKEKGKYDFDPYPSFNNAITIKNEGTMTLKLGKPNLINNLDNKGNAFFIEYNGNKVPLIDNLNNIFSGLIFEPGEERTFNVYFHPLEEGQHHLEMEFTTNVQVTAISILRGYGVYPRTSTEDLPFGQFLIGSQKKTGTIRIYNTNWESADDMIITDLRVEADTNTSFGEFNSQSIFRWDKNNIQDKNGNIVNFPIILKVGEYITVNGEYEPLQAGNHKGRIITVSDAEQEAISNWTGQAIELGMVLSSDTIATCLKQAVIIRPSIKNNGTIPMEITVMSIVNNDNIPNFVSKDFTILLPLGTVIEPNQTLEIPIKYLPNGVYLNNSVVYLVVHTSGIGEYNTFKRIDKTSLTISSAFENFTSQTSIIVKSQNNNGKVTPGEQEAVKYSVILNRDKGIAQSIGNEFTIKIFYKIDFLGVSYIDQERINPRIGLSPELISLGYQLVNFDRKINEESNDEVLTINISGDSSIARNEGDIELITVTFDVYLPYYRDSEGNSQLKSKETEISHLISTNDPCFTVSGDHGTVILDETCVYNIRGIELSANKFNLGQVNPNPVGSQGAEIKFSIGGINMPTEIKIYNLESKLVSIIFNGVLNSGEYSVRIPIELMNNGVYFIDMSSGPFRATKKIEVQK